MHPHHRLSPAAMTAWPCRPLPAVRHPPSIRPLSRSMPTDPFNTGLLIRPLRRLKAVSMRDCPDFSPVSALLPTPFCP
jgi:hypothetical protein